MHLKYKYSKLYVIFSETVPIFRIFVILVTIQKHHVHIRTCC